jgi:hypothetical protein
MRDMPKSTSFDALGVRIAFCGLRSVDTPLAWQTDRMPSTCPRRQRGRRVDGRATLDEGLRLSPAMYSMTRYVSSPSATRS